MAKFISEEALKWRIEIRGIIKMLNTIEFIEINGTKIYFSIGVKKKICKTYARNTKYD